MTEPLEVENIFALTTEGGDEEVISTIVATPNLILERIVSTGHASPEGFWYD